MRRGCGLHVGLLMGSWDNAKSDARDTDANQLRKNLSNEDVNFFDYKP